MAETSGSKPVAHLGALRFPFLTVLKSYELKKAINLYWKVSGLSN